MSIAEDCDEIELRLVRTRYSRVVDDWRLDATETAGLLGLSVPDGRADPTEGPMSVDAETRLRLATEVARGLAKVFDERELLDWLREEDEDGVTPLAFMSRGVTELRAMRAAAAARSAR